jgi:hypothetical protein
MKKFGYLIAVLSIFLLLVPVSALADSSGNFTATGTSAACVATPATFNSNTGDFEGDTLSGGTEIASFSTSIQTPNGKGTTLLIRPSLDTGLFTATKLSTTISNATADVGIQVCVWVDPNVSARNGIRTYSGGLTVSPANCVVYDQRIQQVSNTLFSNLATCIPPAPRGACTRDADCSIGSVCINPTGGLLTGLCQAPAPGCNFEILLTTLSAHSFDFVVPVGNGYHNVVMTWQKIGKGSTAGASTLACVGPVTLTVQQVKNFSNDQTVRFDSN